MLQDPLSAVLNLMEAKAAFAGGLSASGPWSVHFAPPDRIKFFALSKGECLFAVEGIEKPFHLKAGDVVVYAARCAFTLATDLALPSEESSTLFRGRSNIVEIAGGGEFMLFGCHIDLRPSGFELLADRLPPVIHLRHDDGGTVRLQWMIAEMVRETGAAAPGMDTACSGLAQLMFLHVLREFLPKAGALDLGWLRAICDPKLAPAIARMHAEPQRNWHLPELANAAAMSRTAFADHFKTVSGMAPLAYLTRWRMRLAEKSLRDGNPSIATLSRQLGYTSEAAFSTAFKRVTGLSPRQYRSDMRQVETAA
jgi:AraC-like DNA-binding protein